MALHSDDFDNMKGCFPLTRLDDGLSNMKTPTPAHIDAVVTSYSAVTTVFETFMAMDISNIRALPVFNLVRIAYAIVVLIKIWFTAAAPDSELGKVLPKEAIKVDYYLDAMVSKFMAAAAEDKCRPAGKFLFVIIMLRGWLNNKLGNDKDRKASAFPDTRRTADPRAGGATRADSAPTTSRGAATAVNDPAGRPRSGHQLSQPSPSGQMQQQQQQQQQQGLLPYPTTTTANTPLQLLSEVATGDSSMGGRGSQMWQGGSPAPPYFMPNGTTASMEPMDVITGSLPPQWTDAASGMGYLLGDTVDWEAMAMGFGINMSPEQEYEIMNMMAEMNKPWGGDGMAATVPAGQGVYYQQ